MRRNTLGLISLCLFGLGVLLVYRAMSTGTASIYAGGLIKASLVLGAVWLAIPQIDRILARTPNWLVVMTLIGGLLIVVRPWSAILMLPVLIALWVLAFRWKWK